MRAFLASILVCFVACGGDGESATADAGASADAAVGCTPDQDRWTQLIRGKVERYCAQCHGAEPQFGATAQLLDYDGAVTHAAALSERLTEGTMPPAAQPQPAVADVAEIIAWATCTTPDQLRPPNPGGFGATADLFESPAEPPAGLDNFELRAPDFPVPDSADHFECFNFETPNDSARLIRRIDPVIDDSRVVHHLVLMRGETGPVGSSTQCINLVDQVYAWAPGMGGLEFPEGGLRVEAGERLYLQVHYNNRAGHETTDSSGVRIYHGPSDGTDVGMVALGPQDFSVAARSRGEVEGTCLIPQPTTVVASWPHMHESGVGFEALVIRPDGTEIDLVTLDGWDFDTQFVYATPIELAPGDRVVTRCSYENQGDGALLFGPRTEDEMCFNFMYHSPPLPFDACDGQQGGGMYRPGECLGEGDWDTPEIEGPINVGMAPEWSGGAVSDGVWALTDAAVYLPPGSPLTDGLNLARSEIEGRGYIVVDQGRVVVDLDVEVDLTYGDGGEDEIGLGLSVGGVPSIDGTTLTLAEDCGAGPDDFQFSAAGDALQIGLTEQDGLVVVLTFTR